MKESLILSFFFNARGESFEKSTCGLYRALLSQLLEKASEVEVVLNSYATSLVELIKGIE